MGKVCGHAEVISGGNGSTKIMAQGVESGERVKILEQTEGNQISA